MNHDTLDGDLPRQPVAQAALTLPLEQIDREMLALVGGKAAALGELIHAGFAVPSGFCISTAAYTGMGARARLEPILAELRGVPASDPARLHQLAGRARAAIVQSPLAPEIAAAIKRAYTALGQAEPVAVRSSATAEDLPDASFAGQHASFLNVIGLEAVLRAIRECWASLWSDRAVSYRASRGIDPGGVVLAVVVQRMVATEVAGVLFTANPLTGRRRQAVIDASPGLGEAVVAGATSPDHFVLDTATGAIVERRLGDKRVVIRPSARGGVERAELPAQAGVCLGDTQLRALVALGVRVEAQVGAPQDIEWAIDAAGALWLLQARPITTLFPLPADLPASEPLRVYLCLTVQQGTYQPFTPLGISALRLLASVIAAYLGSPPRDWLHGPPFVAEAGARVFLDVTGALRSSFGRAVLTRVLAQAEPHAAAIFQQLGADPRLSLRAPGRARLALAIGRVLLRTGLPWRLLQALARPASARERLLRLSDRLRTVRATSSAALAANPHECVLAAEQLFAHTLPKLLPATAPVMLGSMGALALAAWLLGERASAEECQVVLGGLPFNPTTAMNQALWSLAGKLRADPPAAALVRSATPADLGRLYRGGELPAALQRGLGQFLATYGHRSVDELDMGVPRWSDDPSYLLGVLAGYLQLRDPEQNPERQLERAAQQAEATLAELTRRARRVGRLRGWLVGVCLRRARALGGLREMPRFVLALLLAQARALLAPAGAALAQAGRIERADDIAMLSLPEIKAALQGADLRTEVAARHARYQAERARRQVPLVLLSDGEMPTAQPATRAGSTLLSGLPASPGRATGPARVVFDPHSAQLAQGEILVAPSTDPGWTPLFLTAGGLVTETGGAMSHGAIVAREYGIPAVVGVAGATSRLYTGQLVVVDGGVGVVTAAPQT